LKFPLHKQEIAALIAFAALLVVVGVVSPEFFSFSNIRDLVINNAPIMLIAIGMTFVILTGQIDISVGSQFAVCSIVCGMLAKSGVPMPVLFMLMLAIGGLLGSLNGYLVGYLRLPSIVVTLAMLVILRDALRWLTEGAWVQGLPGNFQWFGLSQSNGELLMVLIVLTILAAAAFALANLSSGRNVYAVGSDAEAARLTGIDARKVTALVFVLLGSLTGLAAMLNAVRFNAIPGNAGIGFELKAIAAVVVGGAAISGGRGRLLGTFIGVALLGTIGTALTFLGINPFWEKAIQGAIILAALVADVALARLEKHGRAGNTAAATA
jgi:rhamnose transport system permease protein